MFALILIGVVTGLTTVLFGFGGGFVTVPVLAWVDASAGAAASTVAVATSSLVMAINAAIATAATPRATLWLLRKRRALLGLLGAGGLGGAVAALAAPPAVISWGFACYLAVTIVDVLARPGFFRPRPASTATTSAAIPAALGTPIGTLAAFLGVGGSVMTVPLLRRTGMRMAEATSLANPLTLCISVPACLTFLTTHHTTPPERALWAVGSLDLGAGLLLLAGSLPIVVVLRRRPPRIPDQTHAWGYLALLIIVLAASLTEATGLTG